MKDRNRPFRVKNKENMVDMQGMSDVESMTEGERVLFIKKLAAALLAFFFLLSLNHIISLWGEGYGFYGVGLFGYNIWAVGLYVIAVWAVYRLFQRKEKRLHVVSGCLGFLLSLGIV